MSGQWIEVDDQLMATIQREAEPFVDSPNDVLRRLLGFDPSPVKACALVASSDPRAMTGNAGRAPAGGLMPLEDYQLPLLRALSRLGGSGTRDRIVDEVEGMIEDQLTDLDRQPLRSGGIRWKSRLAFARLKAVERGHMRGDSRRGVWELTDAGIELLEQLDAESEPERGQ